MVYQLIFDVSLFICAYINVFNIDNSSRWWLHTVIKIFNCTSWTFFVTKCTVIAIWRTVIALWLTVITIRFIVFNISWIVRLPSESIFFVINRWHKSFQIINYLIWILKNVNIWAINDWTRLAPAMICNQYLATAITSTRSVNARQLLKLNWFLWKRWSHIRLKYVREWNLIHKYNPNFKQNIMCFNRSFKFATVFVCLLTVFKMLSPNQ